MKRKNKRLAVVAPAREAVGGALVGGLAELVAAREPVLFFPDLLDGQTTGSFRAAVAVAGERGFWWTGDRTGLGALRVEGTWLDARLFAGRWNTASHVMEVAHVIAEAVRSGPARFGAVVSADSIELPKAPRAVIAAWARKDEALRRAEEARREARKAEDDLREIFRQKRELLEQQEEREKEARRAKSLERQRRIAADGGPAAFREAVRALLPEILDGLGRGVSMREAHRRVAARVPVRSRARFVQCVEQEIRRMVFLGTRPAVMTGYASAYVRARTEMFSPGGGAVLPVAVPWDVRVREHAEALAEPEVPWPDPE